MRKLMLDALDNAVQQHVIKLFNVLMADPENEHALERFGTGISNCMQAYDRVEKVICEKCE
jgi:hypothetical protein